MANMMNDPEVISQAMLGLTPEMIDRVSPFGPPKNHPFLPSFSHLKANNPCFDISSVADPRHM